MKHHFELDDAAFEKAFQNASLDPSLFTHEAHLRLAWIHLNKYGEQQAIENICNQILHYVKSLDETDKYNKTITVAAIKAVKHFMKKSSSSTFQDFILEFPRLKYNFKEIIGAHYQMDIYNAEQAKQEYLEPDLLPFE